MLVRRFVYVLAGLLVVLYYCLQLGYALYPAYRADVQRLADQKALCLQSQHAADQHAQLVRVKQYYTQRMLSQRFACRDCQSTHALSPDLSTCTGCMSSMAIVPCQLPPAPVSNESECSVPAPSVRSIQRRYVDAFLLHYMPGVGDVCEAISVCRAAAEVVLVAFVLEAPCVHPLQALAIVLCAVATWALWSTTHTFFEQHRRDALHIVQLERQQEQEAKDELFRRAMATPHNFSLQS
jgi:hypothetical protein